MTSLC